MKSNRHLDDELAAEFDMHALAARSARRLHAEAARVSTHTGRSVDEEIERAGARRAVTEHVVTMARYIAAGL